MQQLQNAELESIVQLAAMAESFRIESVVRGHHFYKTVWTPRLGEELETRRELDNQHDQFAVTVVKGEQTVGHMPMEISRISWYFLEHRTSRISYKITDKRKLSEKGLEVPYTYVFTGKPSHV